MKKNTLRFLSVVMSAVTAFTFAGFTAPTTVKAAGETVAINATNFPDEDFRNAVSTYLDTDKNGSLSESELAALTDLTIYYQSWEQREPDFDSSQWGTSLCLYNTTDATGIEYFTNVSYLCLSSVINTDIDLTKMTNLNYLNLEYCAELTSLKLDGLNNLSSINIYSCSNLQTLDLTKNPNLGYFDAEWCESLQSIDTTGLTELYSISVDNCYNFKSLDVSTNPMVNYVSCAANYNFSSFKTGKNNKNLSGVYVYGPSLKSLDLSKLSSLQYLALCDCDISLNKIGIKNKNKILGLYLRNNKKSGFVPSEYKNLYELEYSENGATSIDLSKNKKLQMLNLRDNSLKSIDVSGLKKLWSLDVSANKLSKLDVTKNKNLGILYFNNNGIKNIDLSKNKSLYEINAYSNVLMDKLDLSKCKFIYSLWIDKDVKITLPKDSYTINYYNYNADKSITKKLKKTTFSGQGLGVEGWVTFTGKKGHYIEAYLAY